MTSYILKSGIKVNVLLPVDQEVVVGNLHILLLMKPGGGTPDDNIVCFDDNGKELWTIEPHTPVKGDQNPYMSVLDAGNNTLSCSTWKGIDILIDSQTGRINKVEQKRPW